jgi:hypothetical protein
MKAVATLPDLVKFLSTPCLDTSSTSTAPIPKASSNLLPNENKGCTDTQVTIASLAVDPSVPQNANLQRTSAPLQPDSSVMKYDNHPDVCKRMDEAEVIAQKIEDALVESHSERAELHARLAKRSLPYIDDPLREIMDDFETAYQMAELASTNFHTHRETHGKALRTEGPHKRDAGLSMLRRFLDKGVEPARTKANVRDVCLY